MHKAASIIHKHSELCVKLELSNSVKLNFSLNRKMYKASAESSSTCLFSWKATIAKKECILTEMLIYLSKKELISLKITENHVLWSEYITRS